MSPVPTPQITGISDGSYVATCPVCSTKITIVVTDVPIIDSVVDSLGATVSIIVGHTSDFDLSDFDTHYNTEHPE